jgi:hypothetical protein
MTGFGLADRINSEKTQRIRHQAGFIANAWRRGYFSDGIHRTSPLTKK